MQTPICRILYETDSFLIVEKPSGLPTVPLAKAPKGPSLLNQLSSSYPEVAKGKGRQAHEGLVLHRLDTDTCGLVLVARDGLSYAKLQEAQREGRMSKTYLAVVSHQSPQEGFPSPGPHFPFGENVVIESRFRAYGVGRRAVRPVVDESNRYAREKGGTVTYGTGVEYVGDLGFGHHLVRCHLDKGFRHQVRSHLAWTGYPIIGDRIYGGEVADLLHLAAVTLEFPHPSDGSHFRFDWTESPDWTRLSV